MEDSPDRLHPLMTVTALAVTVAALATVGVITGAFPDRGSPVAAPTSAAAATFATRLAADPLALGSPLYAPLSVAYGCEDCAVVESVSETAIRSGGNELNPDHWIVRVRMDDGTTLTIAADSQPSWHAGERVRLVDGVIMSM